MIIRKALKFIFYLHNCFLTGLLGACYSAKFLYQGDDIQAWVMCVVCLMGVFTWGYALVNTVVEDFNSVWEHNDRQSKKGKPSAAGSFGIDHTRACDSLLWHSNGIERLYLFYERKGKE